MDEANKEAFEAQMAASESKYELKLAAWRADGGDAIPRIKELEARQEAKRRARLTREAELKARTASRVARPKVKAWTADEDLVLCDAPMRSCFPIDTAACPSSSRRRGGARQGVNMAPQPLSQNLFTSSTCC